MLDSMHVLSNATMRVLLQRLFKFSLSTVVFSSPSVEPLPERHLFFEVATLSAYCITRLFSYFVLNVAVRMTKPHASLVLTRCALTEGPEAPSLTTVSDALWICVCWKHMCATVGFLSFGLIENIVCLFVTQAYARRPGAAVR